MNLSFTRHLPFIAPKYGCGIILRLKRGQGVCVLVVAIIGVIYTYKTVFRQRIL